MFDRCSLEVSFLPSFPPSFLRSSFLFFFVRCISYAPFVHLWCIDLTFDSLDERPLRESSRGTSRHFEASNVYRKCIESLYKVYRISIESLSNLYRNSFAERLETRDRCLLDMSIFIFPTHCFARERGNTPTQT